jgi:type II secretory pathway pseudopilin PulG
MELNYKKGFTLIEMIIVMAVFFFIIGAALSIFISIIQSQKKVLAEQQFLNQISYIQEYMSKALRMAETSIEPDLNNACIQEGYIYMLTRYDSTTQKWRGIKFLNQSDKGECQEFFLDNTIPNGDSGKPLIQNDPKNPIVLKELKGINTNDSEAIPLTSPSLQIKAMNFSINTTNCTPVLCGFQSNPQPPAEPNPVQPRVTILFKVAIPGDGQSDNKSCNDDSNCSADKACDMSVKKCVTTKMIQTTVSRRNLNVQQ